MTTEIPIATAASAQAPEAIAVPARNYIRAVTTQSVSTKGATRAPGAALDYAAPVEEFLAVCGANDHFLRTQ